ncbi:STAS domain-containing protein [Rossellomorea vietnamensis]|uniref:STAS domain-containing protein n=2 Tax=Rossellomorea TaxID=2837508 RepID=A0A5D4K910_9BACI|nr:MULTISPECIES: STAS domain-containing protein [Rossellomorea]TYR73861.1 STAS domain-containing protein [Rossellomorea vietnamensis]TYS76072.1 STAS domain-containing protein [Rossellomorea aquimaris]
MTTEIQALGKMLLIKKHEISLEIHKDRMADVPLTESQKRDFAKIEPKILELRAEFISLFGEALAEHEDKQKAMERVREWGTKNGEYFFHLGAPLKEALRDTSFYREYIWKAIRKAAEESPISSDTLFEIVFIIDPLLDSAVYYFSLTYVDSFQRSMENARSAFMELSVPVVPLGPEVGILPLIGNIDTERARLLMEETLRQSESLKLSTLVLDLSGVLTVDTMVADQLFKVIEALSLIGVKTIITGIRPEVSHTMVTLGVDLNHLTIKGTLHQALKDLKFYSLS